MHGFKNDYEKEKNLLLFNKVFYSKNKIWVYYSMERFVTLRKLSITPQKDALLFIRKM